MISPAHIKADVVDIRLPSPAIPADLVVDANVLYWVFYPNFVGLRLAGGQSPRQLSRYDRYWKLAANARARFHAASATVAEFVKTAEHAELEAVWLTDPSAPQPNNAQPVTRFDPRVCKFARYHYVSLLATIRDNVESMVASLRKSVTLLPQLATSEAAHDQSIAEWKSSCGDLPDAMMVASGKSRTISAFLSDDSDIATFAGITLYTANGAVVNAARTVGRLR